MIRGFGSKMAKFLEFPEFQEFSLGKGVCPEAPGGARRCPEVPGGARRFAQRGGHAEIGPPKTCQHQKKPSKY